MGYELVVVWEDGTKDIFEYDDYQGAAQGADNFKMAFGNQVQWCGVREKLFGRRCDDG